MLTFAVVGGAGLLLLIVSMAIGEFLDLFDGILSGTAIGAGATLFGAGGFLVLVNGGPGWLAILVAVIAGLLGIVLMWAMSKQMNALSNEQPHEVLGLQGYATTPISTTIGKVQLSHPSEINQRLAVAKKPIDQGTAITVIALAGDRVTVAPTEELGE